MPTLVPYPNCCGGNIIQGFSGDEDACLASFAACVQQSRPGSIVKFVLNEGQCRSYPRVLAEAARVGFVVSAVWNNQLHNSTCIEFQRVGQRLRITDTIERLNLPNVPLAGDMGGRDRHDQNANLPLAEFPHLRVGAAAPFANAGDYLRLTNNRDYGAEFPVGLIARVRQAAVPGGNTYAYCDYVDAQGRARTIYMYKNHCQRVEGVDNVWTPGALVAGTRVRVNSVRSRYHDQEFTIGRVIDGGYDRSNIAIMQENDAVRISINSLISIEVMNAPEYRVVPFRDEAPEGELPEAPAAVTIHREGNEAVAAPRVVYTSYHALFQDDTIGGGYPNADRVREVNPRVRRYRRCDVQSDGTMIPTDHDF